MLNSDQQLALTAIFRWWRSRDLFMILNGKGGVGKSYLLDEVVDSLNCSPLMLCPTHEALKQLRDKVKGEMLFRTVHSALGIAPTTHSEDLKFEQIALPKYWDDIDLVIVDECSMISQEVLDILTSLGKKILFVGHEAQLPPVAEKRSVLDKCEAPVFAQGFPVVTLTIPMRNTGELWDFNNKLEEMIYDPKSRLIPNSFNIKESEFKKLLDDKEEQQNIFNNNLKFVLWSNKGVEEWNTRLRQLFFGEKALSNRYLAGDKILLTKPVNPIGGLETMKDKALKSIKAEDIPSLYSNSKGTVISCDRTVVSFYDKMHLHCYRLKVEIEEEIYQLYEPLDKRDLLIIENHYKSLAFQQKTHDSKKKAFKFLHFVLSLFANCLHSYAMTSHRLQGSSIDSVVVIYKDIQKNQNIVEQKKCLYVACSRAINRLMIYRS